MSSVYSQYKEENKLVIKAVKWIINATHEINKAGGSAEIIKDLSDDFIVTLIRNDLDLIYRGKNG